MSRRTLVAWCPDWPITAVGIDAAAPGAVVEGERIAACTAAARAAGVRRGQRVRDAQRHCPGMSCAARDTDAEGRLFESVVTALAGLTPRLEVVRPGVCAFPARGAARFHGGEQALRVLVQDAVVEVGYDCGVGIADGLFAAELAARAEDGIVVPDGESAEFLAPYPISVLDWPELTGLGDAAKLTDLLWRLGIRTLGDFATLPAEHVAGRFGTEGGKAHRLALGLEDRPPSLRHAETDLSVHTGFDPPTERAEQVVFAAKRLAGELRDGLLGQGLTCVRIAVEVGFADGETCERLWRSASVRHGALSPLAVAERARWQLSAWQTSGGAGRGGVAWLALIPDQVVPDDGQQQSLWGHAEVTAEVVQAAERIQALLGHQAITRPLLTGGRGPADQVVFVPFGDLPGGDPGAGPWPGSVPAPAPSVVPGEPLSATVTDAGDAPVSVSARCAVSAPPARVAVAGRPPVRVLAWTGPWPAEEFWWDASRARRRARLQVAASDGRAYLLMLEGSRWYAEAVYD